MYPKTHFCKCMSQQLMVNRIIFSTSISDFVQSLMETARKYNLITDSKRLSLSLLLDEADKCHFILSTQVTGQPKSQGKDNAGNKQKDDNNCLRIEIVLQESTFILNKGIQFVKKRVRCTNQINLDTLTSSRHTTRNCGYRMVS